MRGRNRFHLIRGGKRKRRWDRADAYGAKQTGGWERYARWWLGAVIVGLGAGATMAYWPGQTVSNDDTEIFWNEVQAVPTRTPDPEDIAWEKRASVPYETAEALPASADMRSGASATFGSCHVGGGVNCVVDGDTLWIDGVKVRVADIDAPETHDYKCASEKALGDRATARLRQLVNSGTVTLGRIDRDEDRYGRKLRIVMVDGESVGDTLVGEGLARWYGSGRQPWC